MKETPSDLLSAAQRRWRQIVRASPSSTPSATVTGDVLIRNIFDEDTVRLHVLVHIIKKDPTAFVPIPKRKRFSCAVPTGNTRSHPTTPNICRPCHP